MKSQVASLLKCSYSQYKKLENFENLVSTCTVELMADRATDMNNMV